MLCASFLLYIYSWYSFSPLPFCSYFPLAFFIPHCTIYFLMSSHFSFILLSLLSSSSIFSKISNLLLISTAYSCSHFEFWKVFTIFLFSVYLFSVLTLSFTLNFIFNKIWSNLMSGPLRALMSVTALLNPLLIKIWFIWFAVLPSAEYDVSLCISLCGNVVLLTFKPSDTAN